MTAIDKAKVACCFGKSVESYEQHAHVQKEIAAHLAGLAGDYVKPLPAKVLEVGCGTGLLTGSIKRLWIGCDLWINDLVEGMCMKSAARFCIPASHCLVGDIEEIPLPGNMDCLLSASVFQWLSHPQATYARLAESLSAGGWLVFSTFGEDNCRELREVTGTGLPYLHKEETIAMLSGHFQVIHVEEEHRRLYFPDAVQVLKHIKQTGVNGLAGSQIWTRGKLQDFSARYARLFACDGMFPLTYHPRYFVCRKRG